MPRTDVEDDIKMSKAETAANVVHDQEEPQTIRNKLKTILQCHRFHLIIIILVAVDCILVITELILDFIALENAQCDLHTELEEISHSTTNQTKTHDVYSKGNHHHEHGGASLVLHYMSLSMLSVFMVELIVKLAVLQREFFDHKWEMFNGIVVTISFILDIFSLVYVEALVAMEALVLLRLWRIVRVVDAVMVTVKTQAEVEIEEQEEQREEAEDDLEECQQYCAVQEKELEALRGEFKLQGIVIDDSHLQTGKPEGLSNHLDVEVDIYKEKAKITFRKRILPTAIRVEEQ